MSEKIHREEILAHAYELAKANGGAPGMDNQSFNGIEAAGREFDWPA
jgi:RNA-directed DNA polymerase